ncbi:MAG: hypothetical protein FWF75_03405 [Propionibacteriaceae bacterium]|nr:hypothetical protein [Propionibacteriaceae bacterium]
MARLTGILTGILTGTVALVVVAGASGCAKSPTPPPDGTPSDGSSISAPVSAPVSPTTTSPTGTTPTVGAPSSGATSGASAFPTATTAATTASADTMDVTIVRATVSGHSLSVAAFVPQLVEDGGTCTLEATPASGAAAAHTTSSAFANAQSTMCEELDLSGLASGAWTIVVTYASPTHHAASAPQQIGIA